LPYSADGLRWKPFPLSSSFCGRLGVLINALHFLLYLAVAVPLLGLVTWLCGEEHRWMAALLSGLIVGIVVKLFQKFFPDKD